MSNQPLTFLFTDLENSTPLWEQFPDGMQTVLTRHDELLRLTVESHQGCVIKTTGDGLHAVFNSPSDAVAAALAGQQAIISETWPKEIGALKVRMGLHTGESQERDGDYFGTEVNRAARIMGVAYGGQILLSAITAALTHEQLPSTITLLDLGEHRLKNLSRIENIYQLNAPGLPVDFPPLKSLNSVPNNLPNQLTAFIGREKEMAEIKAMLESARLVTLTGPGGSGKTRLSIEVGTEELKSFPNGIWMVELAPLAKSDQIILALTQVFGLQEYPNTPLEAVIVNYLSDKKSLLIFDNCEHLIEACAHLADDLLHRCAGLKILANSREGLGIAGEITYATPTLPESESTQLFVDRARAVNPSFDLTDRNAASIVKICSRLDGIPLAIELAAARVKFLTPEQIAARLDDRFRLLVGGSRTALPRQQTLRALIDWSYDLLSEQEKRLLCSASVFVGGWTLAAIEAVSDDPYVLENLEQLVNKSLITTEERRDKMRFSMLETIRQYAHEKLADAKQASEIHARHFLYFDQFSKKLWDAYRSSNILQWRDRADDEVENLRTALEWGLENHVEKAVHFAANFCIISDWLSNQSLGLSLVNTAIDKTKSLPPVEGEAKIDRQNLIARALFAQGLIDLSAGKASDSIEATQEAISISRATGNKLILGYSLEILFVGLSLMNAPGAEDVAKEALTIFTKEVEDIWGLSMAYQNMARISASKGDQEETQKFVAKFNELRQQAPFSTHTGLFLMGLGMSESAQGNYQTANKLLKDAVDVFTRVRMKNFRMAAKSELGHVARRTGHLKEATSIYCETIQGWHELGNHPATAHQLECFVYIAIAQDDMEHAARLLGRAKATRQAINAPSTDPIEIAELEQAMVRLAEAMGEEERDRLMAEGAQMSLDEAVALAISD